jgi:hypothetical protein
MLIDGHCHFVNVTLKMIRAGTNCYTITLCGNDIHEDSMAALGPVNIQKIKRLTKTIIRVRDSGSFTPWAYTPEGREEVRQSPSKKMFVIPPDDTPSAISKNQLEDNGLNAEFAHELERGLDENEE